MNDVDALIQMCCAVPADATRRGVLADKLAEIGESEIEVAIRSDGGEAIIREVHQTADALKRAPCLRLLWAVAVVAPTRVTVWNPANVPQPTPEQTEEIIRLWDEIRERRATRIVSPSDFRWHYDDSSSGNTQAWTWGQNWGTREGIGGNSVTDNH